MEQEIDQFILYLATERGLSDNYQTAIRRILEEFDNWYEKHTRSRDVKTVKLQHLSDYLAHRKQQGLAAGSLRLEIVALKIFFRHLAGRGFVTTDPAEKSIPPDSSSISLRHSMNPM